jgi:hypothetical protein
MPAKFLILPALALGIELLGVAPHALLDRRIDEHLDEFVVANQRRSRAPLGRDHSLFEGSVIVGMLTRDDDVSAVDPWRTAL